jgi:hypothetical protein
VARIERVMQKKRGNKRKDDVAEISFSGGFGGKRRYLLILSVLFKSGSLVSLSNNCVF